VGGVGGHLFRASAAIAHRLPGALSEANEKNQPRAFPATSRIPGINSAANSGRSNA
jgi:hypothetical protein